MRKGLIGACAVTALLGLASIAAAHPGGGPVGGVPGGLPGRSAGVPGSVGNPNGAAPIGRATNAPDTDRGHSEGKGQADQSHHMPTLGRVTSFNGSTLTLTLTPGASVIVTSHDGGVTASRVSVDRR